MNYKAINEKKKLLLDLGEANLHLFMQKEQE